MATVVAPSGERFEGVTGPLLDYYRGEAATVDGYVITDDVPGGSLGLPVVFTTPEPPAKSANKPEWWAFAQSVDPSLADADSDDYKKDYLVEKYGTAGEVVPDGAASVEVHDAEMQDSTSPES